MKIIKKIVIKIIHLLGYDVIRISKDYNLKFLGLNNLPIKSIIDIGANRGQFAKEAAKTFPNANIYCFEPEEKSYLDLKKWADTQRGRVSVFKCALGDKEADLKFYKYHQNSEASSFLQMITSLPGQSTVIHQVTLDNFIKSSSISLEPGILVKIDTQGYDDRVIAGAEETLRKSLACITEVIYDKEYHGQGSFKKIFVLLDRFGFEFVGNKEQHLSMNGDLMWSDSIFKKSN